MKPGEIVIDDETTDICRTLFSEKVALPNLESLELHCVNVERIWQSQQVSSMMCNGFQHLKRLKIVKCPELRIILFAKQLSIPSLETLNDENIKDERISTLCDGVSKNLKCLFSSSEVGSYFTELQELEIAECLILEDLIMVEERSKVIRFPHLQSLKMKNLRKLKSFCPADVHLEFPSLKKLEMVNCAPEFSIEWMKRQASVPKLEELRISANCQFPEDLLKKLERVHVEFDDDESMTISWLDDFLHRLHVIKALQVIGRFNALVPWPTDKIVQNGITVIIHGPKQSCHLKHILKQESSSNIMVNLEILKFYKCHNLICAMPPSTSFQNLTTLRVQNCKGLRKVLTSSTAKSLVRLKSMHIERCKMIADIVATDDAGVRDTERDNSTEVDVIIFSDLKALFLVNLASLTSFCSHNCNLQFPSLENLFVRHCPNMKIFSKGELSTPILHKVASVKKFFGNAT